MIGLIARQSVRQYYATSLAWIASGLALALTSWLLLTQLEIYLKLMPQLVAKGQTLGLWNLVSAPSLSLGGLILMLLTPLLGMNSISGDLASGRISLYLSAPISPLQLVLGKWLGLMLALLPTSLLMLLAVAVVQSGGTLDWGLLVSTALGLLGLLAMAAAISIWMSASTQQGILAGALACALLFLLWLLDGRGQGLQLLSLNQHLQAFLLGHPSSLDAGYFVGLSLFALMMAWSRMLVLSGIQQGGRLSAVLFPVLMCLVLGLSLHLGKRWEYRLDVTANQGNSLHQATKDLLGKLQGPLKLSVFLPDLPVQRGAAELELRPFLDAYAEAELLFIDPAREPERARQLGISQHGQMLVEYGGRSEKLDKIDEGALANALARLVLDQSTWLVALQGHGEAKLSGKANFDLGDFGNLLKQTGYHSIDYDLSSTGQLPANTSLLVIAAPRGALSEAELNQIRLYIEQGGNLLWLDEGQLPEAISSMFGLTTLPGTVVDAAAATLGLEQPTVAVGQKYSAHEAAASLTGPVLMPEAHALSLASEPQGWSALPLVQTGQRSWNETGALTGTISRDASQGEIPGPLTLGWTFSRKLGEQQQRVALIGDADFLSNAYLGNGANSALGLALVHWLTANQSLIDIPPRVAPDVHYRRDTDTSAWLASLLLIGLPLMLSSIGLLRQYLRRRQ